MKNIFKSLMLVAVAATTFTACEKDNNEANKVEQKTVINGVATIDNDTRSSFGDKVGSAYTSKWDGGEEIIVFAGDQSVTTTVDSEGNFTATFEGEVDAITVCSPASQWRDADNFEVPYWQAPLANSVYSNAHILKSEETVVSNGTASVKMKHAAAYGKMTIGVPDGFVVYNVRLNINDELFYEIMAANAENNTIWFGIEPVEVSTLTINAYDINGLCVTKSINMAGVEKPLAFVAGEVSTFSVNGLAEKIEEVIFTSAEALISGDMLNVTFKNNEHTLMIPFGKAAYENGQLKVGEWGLTHMGTSGITWDGSESYSYYCSAMKVVVTDNNVTLDFTWNGDKYHAVYEGTVTADLDAKAPLYYTYLYDYDLFNSTGSRWDDCFKWNVNDLADISDGLGIVFRNDNWDWYTITFNTNGNYYFTPGTYTLGNGIVSGDYATHDWHHGHTEATAAEATISFENNIYTFDVNIDYGGNVIEGTFTYNLAELSHGITAPAN